MSQSRHSASCLARALARTRLSAALLLFLCGALAGCRHKTAPYLIPQGAQAPVELEAIPPAKQPPLIATVPSPEMAPLPPVSAPVPKKKAMPAPREEAPPVQTASEAAPASLAIGVLTTGIDVTPQVQQRAQDMISSILKRIAALPARTAEAQKKQLRQIRHFLDQAQQALNSGDAEGARNLATKARLLMDNLEKK